MILFKWSAWLTLFRYIIHFIRHYNTHIYILLQQLTPFYLHARIIIIFMDIDRERERVRVTPTNARTRIILNHLVSFYTYILSIPFKHLNGIFIAQPIIIIIMLVLFFSTARTFSLDYYLFFAEMRQILQVLKKKAFAFECHNHTHTYVRTYVRIVFSWDAVNEFILSDK